MLLLALPHMPQKVDLALSPLFPKPDDSVIGFLSQKIFLCPYYLLMGNLKNEIYDVKKSFETLKPLKF